MDSFYNLLSLSAIQGSEGEIFSRIQGILLSTMRDTWSFHPLQPLWTYSTTFCILFCSRTYQDALSADDFLFSIIFLGKFVPFSPLSALFSSCLHELLLIWNSFYIFLEDSYLVYIPQNVHCEIKLFLRYGINSVIYIYIYRPPCWSSG